jgi:hypothetical protein
VRTLQIDSKVSLQKGSELKDPGTRLLHDHSQSDVSLAKKDLSPSNSVSGMHDQSYLQKL